MQETGVTRLENLIASLVRDKQFPGIDRPVLAPLSVRQITLGHQV